MAAAAIPVVQGFSQLNRALMYTSALLAPAQALSSINQTGLSNLGFLAYNYYTQITWYRAASNRQLSSLALVAVHANTTLAFAYLGGVFAGNRAMAVLLALGAMGVLWLNNATAWISWKTGQTQGYGEWEFFFFGWRTLNKNWHKFIMVWQISNSLETVMLSIVCVFLAGRAVLRSREKSRKVFKWWHRIPAVPVGGAVMVFVLAPYIAWIEMIVRRNRVESETDWVAVYVFIGQVALMLLPDFGQCWRVMRNEDEDGDEKKYYSLREALGYPIRRGGVDD
ncbi:Nn.00g039620.m01.CDS01 [Neocucurbitaria sp. VM-36]